MDKTIVLVSTIFGRFEPGRAVRAKGRLNILFDAEPIEIRAPVQEVWKVMIDFSAYPLWNPLNRFMTTPPEVKVGNPVLLGVSWGPYEKNGMPVPAADLKTDLENREKITVMHEPYCMAWGEAHGIWHKAERVQVLEMLPNGNTRYHTYERMLGVMSPLISLIYGGRIQCGFREAGLALKTRVESLAK